MKLFQSWMDRIWRLADSAGAERALAIVSCIESIFFPVPPDLMLIPMCLANRAKAFRYASICLVASIVGGVFGYIIGYYFMEIIGQPIVDFYNFEDKIFKIEAWYNQYSAWAVAIAGLTPIPYKVCTLTAGMFKISFPIFIIASVMARGLRFFAVAGLIYLYGEKVRFFLEKRFDLVLMVSAVLVVLGFVAVKFF
ncbi:MAG: DedA family protein [Desulfovibrio sp.]|nr:DedA family protein [Desulfovibrio sp.]MCA1985948.1 DedA family protein [Desulfovibrio sp.]